MLSPLVLAILASTSGAVVIDLSAYANARRAYLDDPIGRSEPRFDIPLFATRLVLGLIVGVQIGLGITTATNAASPAASPTGGL